MCPVDKSTMPQRTLHTCTRKNAISKNGPSSPRRTNHQKRPSHTRDSRCRCLPDASPIDLSRARDVARTTRHARHVTHGTARPRQIPGRGPSCFGLTPPTSDQIQALRRQSGVFSPAPATARSCSSTRATIVVCINSQME